MTNILFKTEELSYNDLINYPDIEIYKNKVTFITGESGSGKSTLLKLFNGTLTQSRGHIFYAGQNILETDTIALRQQVVLISQSVFLFDKSIRENFRIFYAYREEPIPSDDKIRQFLEMCCISFDLDKSCATMSGGERQRVYMALYLSFEPPVILLDEPTSALDTKNSYHVIEKVIRYCKEKEITLIVVSHDRGLTESFAEEVIQLKRGDR